MQNRPSPLSGMILGIALTTVVADAASFEQPGKLKSDDVLPQGLKQSRDHRVDDEVTFDGRFFSFMLESNGIPEPVTSRALLRIRVHEASAMAEISRQLGHGKAGSAPLTKKPVYPGTQVQESEDGPGTRLDYSQIRITGKSTRSSKSGKNKDSTDHAGLDQALLDEYRRDFAYRFQLDPYTTNENVQELLRMLATSKIKGKNLLKSAFLIDRDPQTMLSRTEVDHAVRQTLKDNNEQELRVRNTDMLKAAGIIRDLRDRFLGHKVFSPRHQTYISTYLNELGDVSGKDTYLLRALSATSEVEALYFEQLARMLVIYHENDMPIERIHQVESLIVSKTRSGSQVLLHPVDLLYWSPQARQIMDNLARAVLPGAKPAAVILVSGKISTAMQKELQARGFDFRDNYLAKRQAQARQQ